MRCPNCSTSLSAGTHEGAPIHGCANCSGRFVDFASLQQILANEQRPRSDAERAAAALAAGGLSASLAPDAAPPRACPSCTIEMSRRVHAYDSGVWIDACAQHGVWLDAGELERLEAMVEGVRAGGTLTPAEHSTSVGKSHNVSDETASFHGPLGPDPWGVNDFERRSALDELAWGEDTDRGKLFDMIGSRLP